MTSAPSLPAERRTTPAPVGTGEGHEGGAPARRGSTSLVVVFAALLLVFPSEVAIAGPLRSNGAPARLVGLGMATLLLVGVLRPRVLGATRRSEPVVVVVLVYLAAQLFFFGWRTMMGAPGPDVLRELLFALAACGVALYAAVSVRTLDAAHRVAAVLVAGCSLSALVGMAQAVGLPLRWVDLVTLPGFDQVASSTGGGMRNGLARVSGTASHPIEYGVVLGACLPLALHLALHSRSSLGRQCAMVGAAVMALGLPFALSRGGFICIATAVVVFLAVQGWRMWALAAGGAVVAAFAAYVLSPGLAAALVRLFFDTADDQSIAGRTDDFPFVEAAFNAAPWLGGGPEVPGVLDNQWFVLLTQRGMVGVAAFAMLVVLPLAGALATAWRLRGGLDQPRRSLAAALAGAITAVAVSGGVFDLLSFGQAALLLFLLVGLSAAVHVTPEQAQALRHPQRARSTWTPSSLPVIVLPPDSSTDDGARTGP